MKPQEVTIFAEGYFWCMGHPFDQWDGVHEVLSGYTGGHKENPTYKKCASGRDAFIQKHQ